MSGGSGWVVDVSGSLLMIDVGTNNVWGFNFIRHIFDRNGITASNPVGIASNSWNNRDATGTITWSSISPGGSLWVVDTSGNLKHRRDSSNALRFGSGS
jgi:hypothetical protein